MRLRTLIGLVAVGALALAACGDDDDSDSDAATEDDRGHDRGHDDEGHGIRRAASATVSLAETDLGEVLVDAEGFTLYAFTNDFEGEPTCEGGCAEAWPPALVEGSPTPGEGVDPDFLNVVERSDGTTQIRAGEWPLYRFSGDAAAGDTNGQGSGGVWFAVAADGTLIEDGEPAADTSECRLRPLRLTPLLRT